MEFEIQVEIESVIQNLKWKSKVHFKIELKSANQK